MKGLILAIAVLVFSSTGWTENTLLAQTISLNTEMTNAPQIHVPRDAEVRVSNDHEHVLVDTTITHVNSGKSLVKIESFPPGQTVSLEFPKKGHYSVCYTVQKDSVPSQHRCLQIQVVALQAA